MSSMLTSSGFFVLPASSPLSDDEGTWEVLSQLSAVSAFTLVDLPHGASRREDEDEGEEEEVQEDLELSPRYYGAVIDEDAESCYSVSSRHGFPSLKTEDIIIDLGDNIDAATASTEANIRITFKDALLAGAGGINTAKARALRRPTRRFNYFHQKQKAKTYVKDDDDDDGQRDLLDLDYYSRKAKGFKRYAQATRYSTRLTAKAPALAVVDENDAATVDSDSDSDY